MLNRIFNDVTICPYLVWFNYPTFVWIIIEVLFYTNFMFTYLRNIFYSKNTLIVFQQLLLLKGSGYFISVQVFYCLGPWFYIFSLFYDIFLVSPVGYRALCGNSLFCDNLKMRLFLKLKCLFIWNIFPASHFLLRFYCAVMRTIIEACFVNIRNWVHILKDLNLQCYVILFQKLFFKPIIKLTAFFHPFFLWSSTTRSQYAL